MLLDSVEKVNPSLLQIADPELEYYDLLEEMNDIP